MNIISKIFHIVQTMSAINAIVLGTQLHFVEDLKGFVVFFGFSVVVFVLSSIVSIGTHLEE